MSSVSWIIHRRKFLVFVGLLTGEISSDCWIINRRKCLVFVGLLSDANV